VSVNGMAIACVVSALVVIALADARQVQDPDLAQALALEKTVRKVVEQCSSSVVSVIVSRSDFYAMFDQGSQVDRPGVLGPFDREALRKHKRFVELTPADQKKVLRRLDLADPANISEGAGSGVAIDAAGLVLTPYHIVEGAAKIYVHLGEGQGSYADIHAADPRGDLAVLRLLRPPAGLRPMAFGDGAKIDRGHFVIGLAWPFNAALQPNRPAASWGIVANAQYRLPADDLSESRSRPLYRYARLLLTDSRVNLGVSGGVLLNLKGEAVALTTTLAGPIGQDAVGSVACPMDAGFRRIFPGLKRGEEVEYGFLGVSFDDADARTGGIKLKLVTDGSPAELAGLKEGHVIYAIDGLAVSDRADLSRELSTRLAGSTVQLEVRKPGAVAKEKVQVTLARSLVAGTPIASSPGNRPYFRGLRVDWTSVLVQEPSPRARTIPRGVLVGEVQTGSAAARAELKHGQVITKINDRSVNTPAAFYDAVRDLKGPAHLLLQSTEPEQPATKVILP
jgi:serine protease Do